MVRHEAAESLGNIATRDCIPLLLRALEEDSAEEVKESCEIALDNIRYIRGDVP
jgi:deoxyhypusine monooxygenase